MNEKSVHVVIQKCRREAGRLIEEERDGDRMLRLNVSGSRLDAIIVCEA